METNEQEKPNVELPFAVWLQIIMCGVTVVCSMVLWAVVVYNKPWFSAGPSSPSATANVVIWFGVLLAVICGYAQYLSAIRWRFVYWWYHETEKRWHKTAAIPTDHATGLILEIPVAGWFNRRARVYYGPARQVRFVSLDWVKVRGGETTSHPSRIAELIPDDAKRRFMRDVTFCSHSIRSVRLADTQAETVRVKNYRGEALLLTSPAALQQFMQDKFAWTAVDDWWTHLVPVLAATGVKMTRDREDVSLDLARQIRIRDKRVEWLTVALATVVAFLEKSTRLKGVEEGKRLRALLIAIVECDMNRLTPVNPRLEWPRDLSVEEIHSAFTTLGCPALALPEVMRLIRTLPGPLKWGPTGLVTDQPVTVAGTSAPLPADPAGSVG